MNEENSELRAILEGAILAVGEPLSISRMQSLFEEHEIPTQEEIQQALQEIQASCSDRGFSLVEVASGWRFQVKENLATWVNRLWEEKPQKYSRALLETLALIAYRQPITRGDIEEVRGVAVSSHIIKTLMERDWVKVVGHRDVPGRPALYASTRQFLDYFNLKSLDELPSLSELKDIDSLEGNLDLGGDGEQDAANADDSEPEEQKLEAGEEGEEASTSQGDDDLTGPAVETVTDDLGSEENTDLHQDASLIEEDPLNETELAPTQDENKPHE